VASGSSYVNCEFKPSGILSSSATSVSVTVPHNCNGSNVVSLPIGNAPSAVQINISVKGTHGEEADAWWGFD